jgi:hypothetical protein
MRSLAPRGRATFRPVRAICHYVQGQPSRVVGTATPWLCNLLSRSCGFPFYGTGGARIVERKDNRTDVPGAARRWRGPRPTRLWASLWLVAGIGPSRGLRRLGDGLKLGTHHPVIEPVSTGAGNGNFLRGDRPAKAGPSASGDGLRDAPEARKPRFPRINCEITCEGPNPETGWWAHQGSNLGPDD